MPRIPIELAIVRKTAETAWKLYDSIPTGDPKKAEAANKADQLDRESAAWYERWQKVGGTSDIASVIEAENNQRTAYLNTRRVLSV